MRIGFPIEAEGMGGTRTWIKNFSNYCKSKGHQVYFSHDSITDVFITLAYYSKPEQLIELRKRGTKILYRMDGIYYDFLASKKLTKKNNKLIATSMKLSNKIIYQSNFSKLMASQLFNGHVLPGEVIYNGADTSLFKQDGKILNRPKDKKIILSIAYWGTPPMASYSIKTILRIAKLLSYRDDLEFWILGYAYNEQQELVEKSNLNNITRYNLRESIPREKMPEYIRTADLILHTRPNDACSNLIIEAMNVGKPIVGLNLGSTPELLGDAGLRGDCEPSFQHFPSVDINSMADKIVKTFDNYDYYKKKIIERSKDYTLENMCDNYFTVINKVLND